MRNHGYVPRVSAAAAESWELRVHGLVKHPTVFRVTDLKRLFPTVTLPITMVCAGNRRGEQNVVAKGLGFNWGAGGVSTALFTGVRLADVLSYVQPVRPTGAYPWATATPGRARHVVFEGADVLPQGPYGTSQRLLHARNPANGMLLAWAMNGEPLTPDHGFPLRLIVPGQIGGRMVKWLTRIEVADTESQHHLHFKDNKVLPTSVSADEARSREDIWRDPRYIFGELGVNAAITKPAHREILPIPSVPAAGKDGGEKEKGKQENEVEAEAEAMYTVAGYAYTGGGRRITRVELTLDDGRRWRLAELTVPEDVYRALPIRGHPVYGTLDLSETEMSFCWVFWAVEVPIADLVQTRVLAVRAMDEATAVMPRDMYWNATSMGNNCWFRVVARRISRSEAVADGTAASDILFEHPSIVGQPDDGWMQRLKAAGQNPMFPTFDAPAAAPADVAAGESAAATAADALQSTGPSDLELMTDPLKLDVPVSPAALAAHANEHSPWFVIGGNVYDGAPFLAEHPGGPESIVLVAGEDATDDFFAIHSADAKAKMRALHVGRLDAPTPATTGKTTVPYPSQQLEHQIQRGEAPTDQGDADAPFLHPKKWRIAILESKKAMSSDTYMFRFRLAHADQELGLPIGQHVYLRLGGAVADGSRSGDGGGGEVVQRAYTPFSSNSLRGYIDILIKVYAPCAAYPLGGRMTTRLERLSPGSAVELKGPLGSFTYLGQGRVRWRGVERRVRRLAMVAGGSGITPIWSTIRGVLEDAVTPPLPSLSGDERVSEDQGSCQAAAPVHIWLVNANRTESDILAREHLDTLAGASDGRLRTWHVLSRPTARDWPMSRGRIDRAILRQHLCPPPLVPPEGGLEDTLVLVCGPPPMETMVRTELAAIGWDVDRQAVFF